MGAGRSLAIFRDRSGRHTLSLADSYACQVKDSTVILFLMYSVCCGAEKPRSAAPVSVCLLCAGQRACSVRDEGQGCTGGLGGWATRAHWVIHLASVIRVGRPAGPQGDWAMRGTLASGGHEQRGGGHCVISQIPYY